MAACYRKPPAPERLATGRCQDESPVERLLVIGHRGAAGLAPENTLPGFGCAVGHGVDGVELDVRVAGTEVVVIHDDRVDRTTNGPGLVSELSFDELRRLDAGGGEPIPTLGEVLDAVPAHIMVNIELKGPGTAGAVAGLVRNRSTGPTHPDMPTLLVSSFDHRELRRFHELRPRIACAPLAGRWSDCLEAAARAVDAWSVNLAHRAATPANVAAVRSWGCRCLAYTVNDPRRARMLFASGVTGVFTDYPDRFVGEPASRFSSSASSRCSS